MQIVINTVLRNSDTVRKRSVVGVNGEKKTSNYMRKIFLFKHLLCGNKLLPTIEIVVTVPQNKKWNI